MAKVQIPVLGNMQGVSGRLSQNDGSPNFIKPPQYRDILLYVNIQNTTVNTLNIYGLTDNPLTSAPTYQMGGRMSLSMRLSQKMFEGIIITYANPDSNTYNDVKPLEIIWSDTSLGWQNSYSPSFGASYTGANVNVINTPSVNVANTPAVTLSGSPAVSISGTPAVSVSGTPNVNVINTPNVSVTSTVVDSVEIALTSSQNNLATNLTQAGVAGKNIYVNYINWRTSGTGVVGASNLAVRLLDNATPVYQSAIPTASPNGTNLSMVFPKDGLRITAGNPVSFTIPASGTAGCIVYANMGITIK